MGSTKRFLEEMADMPERKYMCPECNTYHLKIDSKNFAQCFEGFMTNDEKLIGKIIESEDYDGYFTDEELTKFY